MGRLTIEYDLNGERRGYTFTSPTHHYDDLILKEIWRNAMPRGQGWSAARYIGARSIKCFPLSNAQVAVCEVTVTDQEDEHGRRGIRRAVIDTMSAEVVAHHLHSRLQAYPSDVQEAAENWYGWVEGAFPRLKKGQPLVLAYPFATARQWWRTEALVLRLVMTPLKPMRKWEDALSFTTLALSYRSDSQVIAVPAQEALQVAGVPVTYLPG